MLPTSTRPQTSWNQKVDDADSHLPHKQPIRRMSMSWSRPFWTTAINLTTRSRSWHTVLRALACCGPLCLTKQFFSTSPKTLSPRFNLVSGYRGRIWLQYYYFPWIYMKSLKSRKKLLLSMLYHVRKNDKFNIYTSKL